MFLWLLKLDALCQCKKFSLVRKQMYQTIFKTNVNSDVGKMAIEFFIDLLTSTDSDVLRAVPSLSIQLILHNMALMTLDIQYNMFLKGYHSEAKTAPKN